MTQIHQDHNGVKVLACEPWGHVYNIGKGHTLVNLYFQAGPVKDKGVNGITNEALIAVLIHRIGVLNGTHPCEDNILALASLQRALQHLEDRTKNRIDRGVEGTNNA